MQITQVKYAGDYKIQITYADQVKRIFDLEKDIREFIKTYNRFHDMLNKDVFSKVKLNTEWNTLEWENGFDVCPDILQQTHH